jgi:hypothetical protein
VQQYLEEHRVEEYVWTGKRGDTERSLGEGGVAIHEFLVVQIEKLLNTTYPKKCEVSDQRLLCLPSLANLECGGRP